MLTLLLIGMLTLAFGIQPIEADQEPQLLLDTDKDTYILGENVMITLTNVGNDTVEIGGYPAWNVFTYPREEPVYPKIFAFLLWWLDPGENDTITWNQYNEFTQSPAEPGMYVVRDTQGWGLSAYFEIVTAEEEWVPCVPDPGQVDLVVRIVDQMVYVDVTVIFSDAGFNVSNWGTVVKDGYDLWADSEIWYWTGPAALVITTEPHTYDLGHLESGNYSFTFKAWGINIKSINFTVTAALEVDPPVGGIWIPLDKLSLLVPYIFLTSTIILAIAVTGVFVKYGKKQ